MIKRERESLIVASPSNTDPECFVTAALAYKHILTCEEEFYDFNPEVHTEENLVRAPAS